MDPAEAVRIIAEAYRCYRENNDASMLPEAAEASAGLLDWLERGGYIPTNIRELVRVVHATIHAESRSYEEWPDWCEHCEGYYR